MNPGTTSSTERTAPPGPGAPSPTNTFTPRTTNKFATTSPLGPAPITTASGASRTCSMTGCYEASQTPQGDRVPELDRRATDGAANERDRSPVEIFGHDDMRLAAALERFEREHHDAGTERPHAHFQRHTFIRRLVEQLRVVGEFEGANADFVMKARSLARPAFVDAA